MDRRILDYGGYLPRARYSGDGPYYGAIPFRLWMLNGASLLAAGGVVLWQEMWPDASILVGIVNASLLSLQFFCSVLPTMTWFGSNHARISPRESALHLGIFYAAIMLSIVGLLRAFLW